MTIDAPTSRHHAYHQVHLLIERRRYEHAVRVLSDALREYPDDIELQYQSAHLDYLMGRKETAYRTLRQILVQSPTHVETRALLSQVHEDRNELAAAEALLLELLREFPESAWLYAKYAMLMYRTFNIEKAQALSNEALRLAPDSEDALVAHFLGKLIVGDRVAAKDNLSELIRKHPENKRTAYMLITHLTQRGRYAAAKRIAVEILRLQPDSRDTLKLVVELEHVSHWSMTPLWPLNRWGWVASGVIWVVSFVLLGILRQHASPATANLATNILLVLVVYSWIYPPLLKRWLLRRAGL